MEWLEKVDYFGNEFTRDSDFSTEIRKMTIVDDISIQWYAAVANNGHFTYFGGKVIIIRELVYSQTKE